MSEDQVRFFISLSQGTLDISGSEAFVKEQLAKNKEIIDAMLERLKSSTVVHATQPPKPQTSGNGVGANIPDTNPSVDNGYPNVLAISGDDIRVIADIPGKSAREQTINAALLYLLGKANIGENRVSFKEIREVCKRHGFLDPPNFAKHMKSSKREITVHGSGQSMEAELTFPGKKAAQTLAAELESQS